MAITKGIYICANEPTEPSADMFLELGSFNSNNENACFEIQYTTTRKLYYNTFGDDSYEVYNYATKTWTNNAWKTIDLFSPNKGNDWFFANYTKQTTKLSIDLTTLPGWANLSAGNHTIKIKAKGTGYKESELSTGVTVSKAASTVTLEKGTYKWVDSPTFTSSFNETVSYISNGVEWDKFRVNGVQNIITYGIPNTNVYVNRTWVNEAYKTITLSTDQTVSAEFYNWAITDGNLVKQTGYNLTINYSTVPMSTGAAYIKINSDTVSSSNYDYVVQPGTSSTNPTLKNSAGTTLTVPYVVPNVEKVAFMGGLAIAVNGSTTKYTSPYTLTADTTISPGVYGPTADTPIDEPTI